MACRSYGFLSCKWSHFSSFVCVFSLGVTTESAQAIPEEKLKSSATATTSSDDKKPITEDDEDLFEME